MFKVSGTVLIEDTQLGLAGAVVKATSVQGEVHTAVSDDKGNYQIDNMQPGEWIMVAMLEGHHPSKPKKRKLVKAVKDISFKLTPLDPMRWDVDEYNSLRQVANFLTSSVKKQVGLIFPVDVYVQDPYVAKQAKQADDPHIAKREEWQTIKPIYVPCEPDLMRGPTSSRIAVVDYDGDTNKLEDPVEWDI